MKGRRVFRLFARVDGARERRAGVLASYPFRSEERKRRFIRSPRVDRLRQKKVRFSGSSVAPVTSESFKEIGGRARYIPSLGKSHFFVPSSRYASLMDSSAQRGRNLRRSNTRCGKFRKRSDIFSPPCVRRNGGEKLPFRLFGAAINFPPSLRAFYNYAFSDLLMTERMPFFRFYPAPCAQSL